MVSGNDLSWLYECVCTAVLSECTVLWGHHIGLVAFGTVGILEMVGVRFPCSSLLSSCQPLSTTSLSLFISKQSRILPTGHDSYLSSRHGAITGIHWLLLSTRRPGSPRFHTQLNRPSGNLEFRSEKRLDGSSEFIFIPPFLFDLFFPPQNFANPRNMSFTYPKTTGISYSLCVFSLSLFYHQSDVPSLF